MSLSLSVSLFPSLFLSVCVPLPVRLCPCPCLSVSLSVCVPVPVRLCPGPCPSVSQSLSVCIPVPVCLYPLASCPLASLSLCVPLVIRLYSCCVLFQRTSLATDNFQRLFYCQKNQRVTFKVTFVANGQLSADKDGRQRITFSALFDPFNGPNQRKLLFESNLPISGYIYICFFSFFRENTAFVKKNPYFSFFSVRLTKNKLRDWLIRLEMHESGISEKPLVRTCHSRHQNFLLTLPLFLIKVLKHTSPNTFQFLFFIGA